VNYFAKAVDDDGEGLAPLASSSPPPLPPLSNPKPPPSFGTFLSSMGRRKSASARPKSAGIMNEIQREELTDFLRTRDKKLKSGRQLRAKVQKLSLYQRSDLIRALTKLYGDVPKSMQTDRDSLRIEEDD
jgi:hypothetical protein